MEIECQKLLSTVERVVKRATSPEAFKGHNGGQSLHLVVGEIRRLFQYLRDASCNVECARICRRNIQVFQVVLTRVTPDVKQGTKCLALVLLCLRELAKLPDIEEIVGSPRIFLFEQGFVGHVTTLLIGTPSRAVHSAAAVFFDELSRESVLCSPYSVDPSPKVLSLILGVILLLRSASLQCKWTSVKVLTSLLSDASTAKHLFDYVQSTEGSTGDIGESTRQSTASSLGTYVLIPQSYDEVSDRAEVAHYHKWMHEAIPQLFSLLLSPGPALLNYDAGECIALLYKRLYDAFQLENLSLNDIQPRKSHQSRKVEKPVLIDHLTDMTCFIRHILLVSADSHRCLDFMGEMCHEGSSRPNVSERDDDRLRERAGELQLRLTRLVCHVIAQSCAHSRGDFSRCFKPLAPASTLSSVHREQVEEASDGEDKNGDDNVMVLSDEGLVETLIYVACKLRIDIEFMRKESSAKGPALCVNLTSKSLSIVLGLLKNLCEVDDDCMWRSYLFLLRTRIPYIENMIHCPEAKILQEECRTHNREFLDDDRETEMRSSNYVAILESVPPSLLGIIAETYEKWSTARKMESKEASMSSILHMSVRGGQVGQIVQRPMYPTGYAESSRGVNMSTLRESEVLLSHSKSDLLDDSGNLCEIDLGYTTFLDVFERHGYPRSGLEHQHKDSYCHNRDLSLPLSNSSSSSGLSLHNRTEMIPLSDLEIDQVLAKIGNTGRSSRRKGLASHRSTSSMTQGRVGERSRTAITSFPNRHSALAGFATRHRQDFYYNKEDGSESSSCTDSNYSIPILSMAHVHSLKSSKGKGLFSLSMPAVKYSSPVRFSVESMHRRLMSPRELEKKLHVATAGAQRDGHFPDEARSEVAKVNGVCDDFKAAARQSSKVEPVSPSQYRFSRTLSPRHSTRSYKKLSSRSIRRGEPKNNYLDTSHQTFAIEALIPLFADYLD